MHRSKPSLSRTPMSHNLRRSTHFKSLQLHIINGQHHLYSSSATSFSGLGSQVRGCHRPDPPRKLPYRSSLSLYGLLHSPHHHTLDISHFQVPFVLPHSTPLHLQGFLPLSERPFICKPLKLVTLGPNRGYCSVVKDGMSSDEGGKRKADPKEVERVCKVIDELFAFDHNMEAVLDGCGIDLTHDLVVEVLERFRHARKPAFRFFCWAADKNGFSHDSGTYNKMMQILGKTKQFETMISVLQEMGEKGLLTMETFRISIKAFAAGEEKKKAVGLFELMKKYKFKVGVESINLLLDELGKAKLGKEANTLFGKWEHRFTPNIRTYTVLLNGWLEVKNLLEAGKIWNLMIDKGFKPDIVAHNTMLDGLLKCKKRSDSIKLFEAMKAKGPSPNVKSYTILIRDLCLQGEMSLAMSYFKEMLNSDCQPDVAIYTCLITGFGNQNEMDVVYRLLVEMKEKGCSPDAQLYNAIIKLMTSRQMLDEIVQVYKKMIREGLEPTIHTYNMMMKSYFIAKNYNMASAVWGEMKRRGCCPDENSYTLLIGSLRRLGRSAEASEFLEEMLQKGMKAPQLEHDRFAADFSRAGKPDILEVQRQETNYTGKLDDSHVFARWAEEMKKRVKRWDPNRTADKYG